MKKMYIFLMAATLLTSCGTKQAAVSGNGKTGTTTTSAQQDLSKQKLQFVQKVSDNALYQQNVVSKLNFTLQTGSKNISVPGSIHMRKDDVIRIQLMIPIIGTEVGRLEFTKDDVLIIDRLHKQYIKGDYNKIDFLRNRGINFYSLQALFWNQLFIPGTKKVGEAQLSKYDVELQAQGETMPLILRQDKMTFTWSADKTSALINEADITYVDSKTGTSSLNWTYGDFRAFGSKKYPHYQQLRFKTTATKQQKDITVTFNLNGVSADKDWEPRTTVSDKYKAVSVDDVLKQLMNL